MLAKAILGLIIIYVINGLFFLQCFGFGETAVNYYKAGIYFWLSHKGWSTGDSSLFYALYAGAVRN